MKHTFKIGLPKIFDRKRKYEAEMETEVDLSDKADEINAALIVGGVLLTGITIGYFVGFRSGVNKAGSVVIFKDAK